MGFHNFLNMDFYEDFSFNEYVTLTSDFHYLFDENKIFFSNFLVLIGKEEFPLKETTCFISFDEINIKDTSSIVDKKVSISLGGSNIFIKAFKVSGLKVFFKVEI